MQQQLDALTEALVTDPLAVTEGAVHDAEQSVASADPCRGRGPGVARRVAGAAASGPRRAGPGRAEVAAARAAYATTAAKILDPSLPDPPEVDHTLAVGLEHVVGLADAGRWDDAVVRLDAVVDDAAAATRRRGRRLNDRLPRADDRA